MNQIELHNKIDKFVKAGVESADVKVGRELYRKNFDAKQYFLSLADKSWLSWLWKNGFLDRVKQKPVEEEPGYFRMSEVDYLERMAKFDAPAVAEIIGGKEVATTEDNFNPEVVARFIWIIEDMPVEQVKDLVYKIEEEGWVRLMKGFGKSGYTFRQTIKKLYKAEEYDALIVISKAMLSIKTKKELEEEKPSYTADNIFCLNHINEVGLFELLSKLDGEFAEKVLRMSLDVLSEIIKQRGKKDEGVFEYQDFYSLYDSDIFTVDFKSKRSISSREDFENLVVLAKKLIEKTFDSDYSNPDKVNELLDLVYALPENRLIWRLKMFALAQRPDIYKEKIKEALHRLFSKEVGERYFEIEGGAEYHELLVSCFSALSADDKKDYIDQVLKYFTEELDDEDKMKWRRRDGIQILTLIKDHLEELGKKEEAEKRLDVSLDKKDYKPTPTMSGVRGGSVIHRTPEDVSKLSLDEVIEKLKGDYSLKSLKEKYKDDDFLNPRGAEGLGDALKEDVKQRTADYIGNLEKFFNRETIAPNYLYSILRSIEDMLRDKQEFDSEQLKKIFYLFELIRKSGQDDEFTRREEEEKSWLADWITVHRVMADIVLFIVNNQEEGKEFQQENREEVFNVIKYLLTIQASPEPKEETGEYGELFSVAINSVRGRAYEAFVMFAQKDGNELSGGIKEVFESVLEDQSLAVRFILGRYLASFYFRDKEYISNLLPVIFPITDPDKKDIYLATWEGYLSNTLYSKLFDGLKEYYEYAIGFKPEDYTDRKYHKDLDEALAIHIALAFTHLNLKISDDVFKLFWDSKITKRHKEFISFIGRSCLTRSQAGDEWLKENKVDKNKLFDFWDWVLGQDFEPEVYYGFGFWVNPDKEVLDENEVITRLAVTLEKAEGYFDWDYGLMRRLPIFAEKNKEATFEIIKNYLIDSHGDLNKHQRMQRLREGEVDKALNIIYQQGNGDLRKQIYDLVSTLIEKGSRTYWGLKKIIEQ